MLPLNHRHYPEIVSFRPDDRRQADYSPACYVGDPTIELAPASGGANLTDYWQIIAHAKGALIAFSLLGLIGGGLATWLQSPIYRAHALVEIENLNEDFLNIRNLNPTTSAGSAPSPDGYTRSQILVLQSRTVLEKAIDKMDLQKRLAASARPAKKFTISLRSIKNLVSKPEQPVGDRERALTLAADGLKLRAEPNTRMIEIGFEARDPRLAADVANSVPAGAIDVILEKRWQSSQYTSKWLNQQLRDLKTKLEQSEDELQRYARRSNLTFFSEKDNVAEERLRQVQVALSKAHADRVVAQAKYERASEAPGETLPEVLDDPTLKEYDVQATTLRRQLAELLSLFTKGHPKVATVQAQLTAVEAAFQKKRANIIARVRNEYNAAMRQEQLLSRDYSTQSRLVSAQGDKITRYTNLKHEVDATRQLYDAMVQRVREAGVASALRASEIRVIEPATPPLNPFRPNLFYNLALGWFSAVLLGVTVIIARARSDHGVQGPGETSAYLQVPELGVIPAGNAVGAVRQPLWPGRGEARRLELTMCEQRQSIMAESFRLALTSILLSEPNGTRPHVIALSSANPGEGKTMVTCNLAIALAESRGPVLLIDGDLHRPRLHEVFDVDNDLGLVEALAGAPLNLRQTKIPNLHLLTSGKRQAEGVFFASDFHQLIRQVKGQFNTVLIDTPPLLQVADARLIARRADAVILVVAQHTPRDAVLLARQWLAEDGSALLGTILNNWNAKGAAYGYQKYRYYGNSDYRNQ